MSLRHVAPLAVLFATLAVAAPASALTTGIADQQPDMFSDPRFQDSGIEFARRAVAWDSLTSPGQTAALDEWLNAARAAHDAPLISFTHSSTNRQAADARAPPVRVPPLPRALPVGHRV